MICKHCNQDKPNYHFFGFRGKYNRAFFVRPIEEVMGLCFDCAAPYRCVICGQEKDASDFRVQGRVCMDCKHSPLSIRIGLNFNETAEKDAEHVEPLENAEMWGFEQK